MIRLLLFLTITIYSPILLFGDNSPKPSRTKIELSDKKRELNNRPHAPSMQQIECYYDGQKFEIEFLIPEGSCRFVLRDIATGDFFEQTFSSELSTMIPIEGIESPAMIEIYTEYGHVYEGYLM